MFQNSYSLRDTGIEPVQTSVATPKKTWIKSVYNYCDLPCDTSEHVSRDGSYTSICPLY